MGVAASVDTGASFCLFGAEIAEALGLDLEAGIRRRFRTANSRFDAFGHEVELGVFGVVTNSVVYFFVDPMIDKNVLGRIGWLDRVRLGLIHHDRKAYLAPYDQS
jgi:predicted aspartyl protease